MKIQLLFLVTSIFISCSLKSNETQSKKELNEQRGDYNQKIESSVCYSIKNSIGVITKGEQFSGNDTIKIFNEDRTLWHEFSIAYDDSDGIYDFQKDDFSPFAFNPDNGLIAFVAKEGLEDGFFKIVSNEQLKEVKLINPKRHNLKLLSWDDFLVSKVFSVSFDKDINPLILNGNKVESGENSVFQPIEVEGDFLKVEWDNNGRNVGWIKWRQDDCLLIELFFYA